MSKEEEKLKEMEEGFAKAAESSPYQAVEIRICDADGNVKGKTAMYVKDMLALEGLHGQDRGDTVRMLFRALEEELIRSMNDDGVEDIEDENNEDA